MDDDEKDPGAGFWDEDALFTLQNIAAALEDLRDALRYDFLVRTGAVLRLDRRTGHLWQLVKSADPFHPHLSSWQPIPMKEEETA